MIDSLPDARQRALDAPDAFWLEQAARLDRIAPPTQAGDWSFAQADFRIRWFADGVLNVAANCIDRHLATRGGPIATPDAIQFAPALPKTRSGRIMRRILRKIAGGETPSFGDTSTPTDPDVVDRLVADRVDCT